MDAKGKFDGRWEALVRRLAGGDDEALGELYAASSWIVSGVASAIVRDSGDAEDVVVDVYLQVWQQAQQFDERRGSARAWLKTITRSRALDQLRRRPSRACEVDLEPVADELMMPTDDHRRFEVRDALAKLGHEQRQAVELAFLAGLSHAQVARRLRLPVGTVKSRIRAGLSKLRVLLRDVA